MNDITRVGSLAPLVLALAASACHKPEAAEPGGKSETAKAPPVTVELAPVEVRDIPRTLTLTGSVGAEREAQVAANVAGRIALTSIERGQQVKVGQVLATVDSKTAGFQAQASSAQAMLADTQASQAQQDCARADWLFSKGSIANAEYDRQKTQCKAQELAANAARAQAGLASRLVSDTVIRAPFAGAIGERFVSVGEYVQPQTRVASIYVVDPIRVTVSVPEAAVGQVRAGQSLDVHVAAWPDRGFPATVVYLSPALRPSTRDLLVEARAANADGALRPGMFATVRLEVGSDKLATVPEDAIVETSGSTRVFAVKDGKAYEMVVRTGAKKDGRIAVYETFEPGARVIRRPPSTVHDGASVVEGAPSPAAPAPSSASAKPSL
jgi:membrane fusion protein, multidrug efflux system